MQTALSDVVVAADAAPGRGLGHLSRSGAVAAALRARGLQVECFGLGASTVVRHDAIEWRPAGDADAVAPPRAGGLLVLDSYAVSAGSMRDLLRPSVLAVMHGRDLHVPVDAVVSPVPPQVPPPARVVLSGLEYACLRSEFWELEPLAPPGGSPARVLVTGGGEAHREVDAIVDAVLAAAPDLALALVRGPGAPALRHDVEILDSPPSLLPALRAADIVISAGGQTVLEALAVGRSTVVFVVAENQARQARYLADRGLVRRARLPRDVAREVQRLAADAGLRGSLERAGAAAVDGRGALRVAARLAALLED